MMISPERISAVVAIMIFLRGCKSNDTGPKSEIRIANIARPDAGRRKALSFTQKSPLKKSFLLAATVCLSLFAVAQADTTPVYKRFPSIPPFKLTKISDSTSFGKDDLEKKKATVFIIFNPFCDHCKHEIEDIKTNIDLFKDVQVILASPIEFQYLKRFYEDLKIAGYPNMLMGRDPTNFLGTFFKVESVPAVFIYNRKGHFVTRFDQPATAKKIAENL